MSDYDIKVDNAVTISIDYEEYTLDRDQAEDLYSMLGLALGRDTRTAA